MLITLDTTRADRLGCYGYHQPTTPHLDQLAAQGAKLIYAYSPVPLTLPAHVSLLTGLYPFHHGVRNNGTYSLPEDIKTIGEFLRDRGYKTAAFISSFILDKRFGLSRGFEIYDDELPSASPFKNLTTERSAAEVFASFSNWFRKEKPQKFFCWVHFYDPHFPYQPPQPYRLRFSDPYDGEIAYMDKYVGEILQLLEEENLNDSTVVIAVADHGEAFGEKVEQGHGIFLYEMAVRVPLIIKGPGIKAGFTITEKVSLVDIVPTIIDWLGLKTDFKFDGRSLLPLLRGKHLKQVDVYLESFYSRENYGWAELVGLVSWPWKFISAPRPELYQLESDPEETLNLAEAEKEKAASLKSKLLAFIAGGGEEKSAGARRSLQPEELNRLRSLGYIQLADAGKKIILPDPKDRLDELKLIQEATRLEYAGRFAEAEKIYLELLALNPNAESYYVELARLQGEQKKFALAAETLSTGLQYFPSSEYLLSRLALALYQAGKFNKAKETVMKILQINAGNFDALVILGLTYEEEGALERALDAYQRALLQEPRNEFLLTSRAEIFYQLNRLQEALETYIQLTEIAPENPRNYLNAGIIARLLGDLTRAIPLLEKAISLSPSPKGYLNLAVAYLEEKRYQEAARALDHYLANPAGEDPQNIYEAKRLRSSLSRELLK